MVAGGVPLPRSPALRNPLPLRKNRAPTCPSGRLPSASPRTPHPLPSSSSLLPLSATPPASCSRYEKAREFGADLTWHSTTCAWTRPLARSLSGSGSPLDPVPDRRARTGRALQRPCPRRQTPVPLPPCASATRNIHNFLDKYRRTLHVRKATRAEPGQRAIYDALGVSASPGGVRKMIVERTRQRKNSRNVVPEEKNRSTAAG